MATVLNRLSRNLNNSVNQVHSDLQSSRFSPLKRTTSNSSIRSNSTKHSVSSFGNPYKSTPSDPQITDVSANSASPATNLLSSFTSVLPHTLERKLVHPMDSVPPPNAPPGAPPLPVLPIDIPLPHPQILLDTDKPFKDRLKIVLGEFKDMFSAFAHIFWLPLSWFLTFMHSGAKMMKSMMLLPLTIFITIYERRIRAKFPWLPSIWLTMNLLFPSGILPSFSSMDDLGEKLGVPSMNSLPTLDIDMDAIRAGNSDAIASSISNLQGAIQRK